MNINCKGKLLSTNQPLVMGILNITDNSFYDGGKYLKTDSYLFRIEKMLSEGADIIDIGCMATNPKAEELSEYEELKTTETALKPIISRFQTWFFPLTRGGRQSLKRR
jgi:dihydropteroate synthase